MDNWNSYQSGCTIKADLPEQIGGKMLKAVSENDVTTIKSLISDDFLVRDCPKERSVDSEGRIRIDLSGNCLKNLLKFSIEEREELGKMAKTAGLRE